MSPTGSIHFTRADSRRAPSQQETSLQSNAVSYWLGTNLESALFNLARRIAVPSYPVKWTSHIFAQTQTEWHIQQLAEFQMVIIFWNSICCKYLEKTYYPWWLIYASYRYPN